VHLRRALLLFAIVLGLAAIAASVSREPEESGERAERPAPPASTEQAPGEPSASSGSAPAVPGAVELSFDAARDQRRRLDAGQPASVMVEVDEPGLAEIAELGLSAPADPLTPARLEVLVPAPARLELTFTPVDGGAPAPAGTLVVRAVEE
jgi:hypothetical protein